ncbi:right-handed parallel beta-helix repeat-containing protein [Pseudomonas sp. D4-18]|uniref:right-handed parallel beta-helix repeat-containing protein n=1 Tax=Pseudomonas sp. D4-18 TaxID=2817395 RepID=UPI003DAA29B8
MTDQTQRLEIATVRAEIGSNIIYRFSNDEITDAGIPTESGDIENLKQIIKSVEDKASVSTSIYPTVADGLAATAEGGMFLVASADDDEIYEVWRKTGGVAVDTGKRALSSQAIEDATTSAEASASSAADSAAAAATLVDTAQAEYQGLLDSINNIQDPATPDFGASMVGFRRSAETLPGYVADQLRGQAIQLFEFIPASQRAAIKAGTSVYDATANVQAAIDYAVTAGAAIEHDDGVVCLSHVYVPYGFKGIIGRGTIKFLGSSGFQGVIEIRGSFHGAYSGVNECCFSGITFDFNNLPIRAGIFASSATNSTFDSLKFKNFGPTLSVPSSGIRFAQDCSDNFLSNNKFTMPVITDPAIGCYGIQIVGSTVDAYGGWGGGAFVPATNKCARNEIVGNYAYNGTHGISLSGADQNTIALNYLNGQFHRSIHMSPQASANLVIQNQCLEFGSSGIIMGYSCNRNRILCNNLYSSLVSGEGAIQAYVGCTANSINYNVIRCGANFGIYLAVDATYNVVMGNEIDAQLIRKAAIAIESDWIESPSGAFIYSRPNWAAPPGTRTFWASAASTGNVIKGNPIIRGNGSICAIYLAQLNNFDLDLNSLVNNYVECSAFAATYSLAEASSGRLKRVSFSGNTTSLQELGKASATRGRAHFNSMMGNDTFNGLADYAPAANTAQPSAFFSDKINLTGYTSATTITAFPGGMPGQTIRVRLNTFSTIASNASIVPKGGATAGVANGVISFENIAGVWTELSRNF